MHTRLSPLAAVPLLAGGTSDAAPDANRPAEARAATRPP